MVEFHLDTGTLEFTTNELFWELPLSVLVDTDLEVIITAFIPDLRLLGIPVSTDLTEGKIVYLTVTSIVIKYFVTSKMKAPMLHRCKTLGTKTFAPVV